MKLLLTTALHVTSLFFIFSHFSPVAASPTSRGLNGDDCITAANCKGSRTCYYLPLDSPPSFGPCDKRDPCYCGPPDFTELICSSNADCIEPGELCATVTGFNVSGCLSLAAVEKHPQLALADADHHDDTDISPPSAEQLPDMDTQPFGEELEQFASPEPELTPPELTSAENDFDLDISPQPEEQFSDAETPQFSDSEGIQGIAEIEEPDPSSSPESESACIAVHHLQHLSAEQLLFPTHVRAKVLCDPFPNCATPGHVVQFDGQPMMMKSYCALVTCQHSVRLVNSPKYQRGARISSKSPRLVFTAFAARFESRMEEKLLSVAVRIGL